MYSHHQLKEGVASGRGAIILVAVGPPPADEASSFLSAVGDASSYSTFILDRASPRPVEVGGLSADFNAVKPTFASSSVSFWRDVDFSIFFGVLV